MGTMFREPSFVKACSKATNPSPGWSSQIVGVEAHRNLRCSWICSATSSWGQCHQLMCWPGGITTQPCSMKETIIFCSGAAHGAFLGSLEYTACVLYLSAMRKYSSVGHRVRNWILFALSKETTQWSLAGLQVQAGGLCLRQEKLLLAFSGTMLMVGSIRVLEGQEMSLQIVLLEGGCTRFLHKYGHSHNKIRLM